MLHINCPRLLSAGKLPLSFSPNISFVRYFIVTMVCCFVNGLSFSQTLNEPVGQCFENANRRAIEKRIEKLKVKASKDMNCSVESISYVIDKKFTHSYSKECRHLPKVITFQTRGQKKTYKCLGLSGLAGSWLLATWEGSDKSIID